MNKNENAVHLYYAIGILCAICTILISIDLSSNQQIASVISFGVGLSSLILAVVAIIQSIVGANRSAEFHTEMQRAASDMRTSSSALHNVSDSLSGASKIIDQSVAGLVQQIEALPARLDSIKERLDETHDIIHRFTNGGKSSGPNLEVTLTREGHIDWPKILTSTTNGGRLALYTLCKAFDSKRVIKVNKIFPDVGADYYISAYLEAFRTAGLIKVSIEEVLITALDTRNLTTSDVLHSLKDDLDDDADGFIAKCVSDIDEFFQMPIEES